MTQTQPEPHPLRTQNSPPCSENSASPAPGKHSGIPSIQSFPRKPAAPYFPPAPRPGPLGDSIGSGAVGKAFPGKLGSFRIPNLAPPVVHDPGQGRRWRKGGLSFRVPSRAAGCGLTLSKAPDSRPDRNRLGIPGIQSLPGNRWPQISLRLPARGLWGFDKLRGCRKGVSGKWGSFRVPSLAPPEGHDYGLGRRWSKGYLSSRISSGAVGRGPTSPKAP